MKWKKGQSGNPRGRPKVNMEFRELCRLRTPEALKVIDARIKDGDIEAARYILDQAWGKAVSAPAEPGSGENVLTVLVRKFSDRRPE